MEISSGKSKCITVPVFYLETIEILNCVTGIVRTKKKTQSINKSQHGWMTKASHWCKSHGCYDRP